MSDLSYTDQIGEWCAVLESMGEREMAHPYRAKKLGEISGFLRKQRYTRGYVVRRWRPGEVDTLQPEEVAELLTDDPTRQLRFTVELVGGRAAEPRPPTSDEELEVMRSSIEGAIRYVVETGGDDWTGAVSAAMKRILAVRSRKWLEVLAQRAAEPSEGET